MFTKITSLLEDISLPAPQEAPIYRHWADSAGAQIAKHTLHLEFSDTTLNVVVDSPTWAHQLIHKQQSIADSMKNRGYHNLSGISIRVKIPASPRPVAQQTGARQGKDRKVSPEMLDLFEKCAGKSASDEVAAAFKKLSKLNLSD